MLNHNVSVVSVGQLNTYLKSLLDSNPVLNNLLVKGEISNLKYYPSGHIYFSLKDNEGIVKCVMFSTYASKLNVKLQEGEKVIVNGSLSLYGANGTYQIYVKALEKDGIGNLYLEFEKLKKELNEAGLFDENHKKQIPLYPMKIGVISGKTAAGLRDILTILKRRWPIAEIIIFPCTVQGKEAPVSIIKALEISQTQDLDVTILARGGGSQEDLWCFNDKQLAYAIYNYKIPIVTGIGHEIDYTIADFVSDLRAPTPSGAAEMVTPNIEELLSNIKQYKNILINRAKQVILDKKATLLEYENYLSKENLFRILENNKQLLIDKKRELKVYSSQFYYLNKLKIQESTNQLKNEYKHYLMNKRTELLSEIRILDNLSPLKVLQRGYSIVSNSEGTINTVKKVDVNDVVRITMADGKLYANVVRKDENNG